jgi:uncharacterized protein
MLRALQRQLTYFPSPGPVPPAARVVAGARDVRLTTNDGLELGAWHLPAGALLGGEPAMTVLVANGNGGDRSLRAQLARALAQRGLGVLLFDYRGYGGNPGAPSEQGLALDVRAARDHLVEQAGVLPGRLLYFGESLGSAVVTELATEHPPAGMLLRSPFVDLAAVGQVHYPYLPVRMLLRDRYPLVEHLRRVGAPVAVVYGAADTIVPPGQSRTVAAAARNLADSVEIAGADHDHPALLSGSALVDAVTALASRAGPR